MSDREFENYLTFMSRMLRLSGRQREAIACELRDHLEQRLEELTEQGVERDDAVAQALEEFGDAAGLAAEFTRIANQRQRRFIMRITLGSLMATAAAVLLFLSLMPSNHPTLAPHHANADEAAGTTPAPIVPATGKPGKSAPGAITGACSLSPATATDAGAPADENQAIEKALATRFSPDWTEQPLADVLDQIRKQTDVNMHIDWPQLENAGVTRDQQVTLNLKSITAAKAIELVLRGTGAMMRIEDGIVMITSSEQAAQQTEVRVYNCRDLLALAEAAPSSMRSRSGSGRGMPRVLPPTPGPGVVPGAPGSAVPGGLPGPGGPGGSAPGGTGAEASDMALALGAIIGSGQPRLADGDPNSLLELIVVTVAQDSWQMTGGNGSIHVFDGLLVINHTPEVHRKVTDLLRMIRAAAVPEAAVKVK